MNENLKKIHKYLMERGVEEKQLLESDTSSVYLAMEIMEYAHRNQKRENGEDYANHPARCLETYRRQPHRIGQGQADDCGDAQWQSQLPGLSMNCLISGASI